MTNTHSIYLIVGIIFGNIYIHIYKDYVFITDYYLDVNKVLKNKFKRFFRMYISCSID